MEIYNTDNDEQLSEAVARALASEIGTRGKGGLPLQQSIDTDALDRLFRNRDAGTIRFEHAGVSIEVDTGGEIRIDADLEECN